MTMGNKDVDAACDHLTETMRAYGFLDPSEEVRATRVEDSLSPHWWLVRIFSGDKAERKIEYLPSLGRTHRDAVRTLEAFEAGIRYARLKHGDRTRGSTAFVMRPIEGRTWSVYIRAPDGDTRRVRSA